jgi:DNA-binding MarR family transcriptional regulator
MPGKVDDPFLLLVRDNIEGRVQREGPDLTVRQLAVLMVCAIDEGPHTVRGVAARLRMSRPAVTRAVDRLTTLGLMQRLDDPRDRRSVLLRPSRRGTLFVGQMRRSASRSARAYAIAAAA